MGWDEMKRSFLYHTLLPPLPEVCFIRSALWLASVSYTQKKKKSNEKHKKNDDRRVTYLCLSFLILSLGPPFLPSLRPSFLLSFLPFFLPFFLPSRDITFLLDEISDVHWHLVNLRRVILLDVA